MPPEQSNHPSNYDFIMNPEKPKRRSLFPIGGSSKQRLLMLVAGILALLIILVLFFSMFLGGQNNSDKLLSLAQEQTEVIRVSDIGVNKARESKAKNLAAATKLAVQTDHNATVERLKKLGKKAEAKTLSATKNTQTDQKLDTAAINSKFDETFVQTLQEMLVKYRTNVKSLYDSTGSSTEKQFLASSYDSTSLLLKQTLPAE